MAPSGSQSYADADGFVEVAEAPTGFMCIKRACVHADDGEISGAQLHPGRPAGHPEAHLHWLFFDCMVDPDSGRYLSEDYAFCRRWSDIGGKVWVDLHCKLSISGSTISAAIWPKACGCRAAGRGVTA